MPIATIQVSPRFEEIVGKRIRTALVRHMKKKRATLVKSVRGLLRESLADYLENSDAVKRLFQARIFYEIGIPDLSVRLQEVFNTVAQSVEVDMAFDNTSLFRLEVRILESSYQDLFNGFLATFSYINKKGVSHTLSWLEWLLIGGSSPQITTHFYANLIGKGRTGGGIMVKGGQWSVPSSVSGIFGDNFLTKALIESAEQIKVLIHSEVRNIIQENTFGKGI